jgi:hypothetical protein
MPQDGLSADKFAKLVVDDVPGTKNPKRRSDQPRPICGFAETDWDMGAEVDGGKCGTL